MNKKFLLSFFLSIFAVGNLFSEEAAAAAPKKEISYNIALDAANTYLWRGYNTYVIPAGSGHNTVFDFAPGLFPSITVTTPSGFSFNIWNATSLLRDPKKRDLSGYDEIDFTGTYTITDVTGTFTASAIAYVYPTSGAQSYGEGVFSYTAPWDVLNPTVAFSGSLGQTSGSYEYAYASISHVFEAGILSISPKIGVGYWLINGKMTDNKMHLDVNVPFGLAITDNFEVHLGITGCYRILGFDKTEAPFILIANLGTSFSF